MTLTTKQAQHYLSSGGDHCPYCLSKDIWAGTPYWREVGVLSVFRGCRDCLDKWTDHYALVGVDEHVVSKKGSEKIDV